MKTWTISAKNGADIPDIVLDTRSPDAQRTFELELRNARAMFDYQLRRLTYQRTGKVEAIEVRK